MEFKNREVTAGMLSMYGINHSRIQLSYITKSIAQILNYQPEDSQKKKPPPANESKTNNRISNISYSRTHSRFPLSST